MNRILILFVISSSFLIGWSVSFADEMQQVIPKIESENQRLVELIGLLQELYYEETGKKISIYVSPEVALSDRKHTMELSHVSLDVILRMTDLKYEKRGDVFLIDLPDPQ
jgi:hypothetical protein